MIWNYDIPFRSNEFTLTHGPELSRLVVGDSLLSGTIFIKFAARAIALGGLSKPPARVADQSDRTVLTAGPIPVSYYSLTGRLGSTGWD
ncbi:hypothetical protein VTN49DRAFT_5352 [Thermomyces lanuginosus]|uniref:uncharacterized protein n=1 Tax=Thermomyces lanuginosus TaxID=5541 RepID=UPI00374342C6